MIICDKCNVENENSKDIDFFKVYIYPQYATVKHPYKIDICDNCLMKIMGKELFLEMCETLQEYAKSD